MAPTVSAFRRIALRELALFLCLLFAGMVVLPIAIYLVGQAVFGAYGGAGFGDFYASLHYELRHGQKVTWYLVLSPYLVVQLFRVTLWSFLRFGRRVS